MLLFAAVWNALATAIVIGTSARRNQGSHRSGSDRINPSNLALGERSRSQIARTPRGPV
jgi:hypothetical protein